MYILTKILHKIRKMKKILEYYAIRMYTYANKRENLHKTEVKMQGRRAGKCVLESG